MKAWKWFLLVLVAVAAANGIWIAYVAQSGYTPRAMVYEGLNLALGAKHAVDEYYAANRTFPENSLAAGIQESVAGRFVEDVSITAGGIIQVTYDGTELDGAIKGKKIFLRPVIEAGDDEVTWQCTAEEIPRKYRPIGCK